MTSAATPCPAEVEREVREDFAAFLQVLPEILEIRRGRIALMRGQRIVYFSDTRQQARAAAARYSEGIWSIQEVTDEVACVPTALPQADRRGA